MTIELLLGYLESRLLIPDICSVRKSTNALQKTSVTRRTVRQYIAAYHGTESESGDIIVANAARWKSRSRHY
jgi:hypothetical protein